MRRLLLEAGGYRWRPFLRQDLERTDIEVAVMKECLEFGHFPREEAPILADAVAAHRGHTRIDPRSQKCERRNLGVSRADVTLEYPRGQSGSAVLPGVPFIHPVHGLL